MRNYINDINRNITSTSPQPVLQLRISILYFISIIFVVCLLHTDQCRLARTQDDLCLIRMLKLWGNRHFVVDFRVLLLAGGFMMV